MAISKEAAHARALKAAETRRRNKANGATGATGATGASTKAPKAPRAPKQPRIKISEIRKASTAELRAAYDRMSAPGWQWQKGDDKRYYGIKDELQLRANPNLALYMQRAGYRDIGGTGTHGGAKKRGKKRSQRVSASQPRAEKTRTHRTARGTMTAYGRDHFPHRKVHSRYE